MLFETPTITLNQHTFPPHIDMAGWKEIPIQSVPESEDPLISLNQFHPRIKVDPQYYRLGLQGTSETLYARKSVAKRLVQATEMLPVGFNLLVWDPYRSVETQKDLYDRQYTLVQDQHPDWNPDQLSIETQRYVSLPSTILAKPSPHLTGGAIDLTICDNSGILLDMGTEFDYFGPEATTDYFAQATDSKGQSINNNRLLLLQTMALAGFTNYWEEWWHFDYGNQFWAKIGNHPCAIFGPAFINNLTD